jgi:hypothetical protein
MEVELALSTINVDEILRDTEELWQLRYLGTRYAGGFKHGVHVQIERSSGNAIKLKDYSEWMEPPTLRRIEWTWVKCTPVLGGRAVANDERWVSFLRKVPGRLEFLRRVIAFANLPNVFNMRGSGTRRREWG